MMPKIDLLQVAFTALQPQHLELLDESHMHSRGLETHYKAVIVSQQFAGLNAVKRHQKAYAAVGELMDQIHALALHTYTPDEWAEQGVAPASPTCKGGH
jgi:BolA protein